nr:hypothetical protein [FCB group bacterium]
MMKKIDIKDKLGQELVKRGLLTDEDVRKALKFRDRENASRRASGERRSIRNLAQVVVDEMKIDHDIVFEIVASLYGFKEYQLTNEDLQDRRLEFIRKMFEPLPQAMHDYMVKNKIVILRYDQDRPYRVNIAAAAPTDRTIPDI